jgi:hypothetical protein
MNGTVCSASLHLTVRFGSSARTFNPKVTGSIPVRPIKKVL